jgi:hypothetical protein
MFWFDRKDDRAVFCDNRRETVRVEVTAMLSSRNMFELGTVGSEEKPR